MHLTLIPATNPSLMNHTLHLLRTNADDNRIVAEASQKDLPHPTGLLLRLPALQRRALHERSNIADVTREVRLDPALGSRLVLEPLAQLPVDQTLAT